MKIKSVRDRFQRRENFMIAEQKLTMSDVKMSALDAINNRCAVRNYKDVKIDKSVVNSLLNAAVRAPTAMHKEPWCFCELGI